MKNQALLCCCALFSGAVHTLERYHFNNCEVLQFKRPELSVYSYLLCSKNEALLIDPLRNLNCCESYLEEHRLKLKGVFLTHTHADFVAGHGEAAAKLHVPIFLSEKSDAKFPYEPQADNAVIPLGKVSLEFLATPGHTPDSMCLLVRHENRPEVLFTGDTLFVGSVGRPDLLPEQEDSSILAGQLYDSWQKKLAPLPDTLVFFPAHGAGSLCGVRISDRPYSTIGSERRGNSYLLEKDKASFVRRVLSGLPPAPRYFHAVAKLNRQGPPPVNWRTPPVYTRPREELADFPKFEVADIRSAAAYAAGHVPNSLNIGSDGKLELWIGTMVPPESELILVSDSRKDLEDAVRRLLLIGYSAKALDFDEWKRAGMPISTSRIISAEELERRRDSALPPVVLDVRTPSEIRENGTVPGSVNFSLAELPQRCCLLSNEQPVVAVCLGSYRASLAVGILERHGISDLAVLGGGFPEWLKAGKLAVH